MDYFAGLIAGNRQRVHRRWEGSILLEQKVGAEPQEIVALLKSASAWKLARRHLGCSPSRELVTIRPLN